jgi:hypothetical protein
MSPGCGEFPESVDEISSKYSVEAGPLCVCEPRVIVVCVWVFKVNFFVGNIQITTENHRLGEFKFFNVGQERLIPLFGSVIESG